MSSWHDYRAFYIRTGYKFHLLKVDIIFLLTWLSVVVSIFVCFAGLKWYEERDVVLILEMHHLSPQNHACIVEAKV